MRTPRRFDDGDAAAAASTTNAASTSSSSSSIIVAASINVVIVSYKDDVEKYCVRNTIRQDTDHPTESHLLLLVFFWTQFHLQLLFHHGVLSFLASEQASVVPFLDLCACKLFYHGASLLAVSVLSFFCSGLGLAR